MIIEDYVSLEVAKLLKGKGYNEVTAKAYNPIHKYLEIYNENNEHIPNGYFSAPTLCHAQKWLMKEKGIYIWVEPVVGYKWTTSSCDFNVSLEESDWIERELHKDGYPIYESYKEALNAGMLEVLKLI